MAEYLYKIKPVPKTSKQAGQIALDKHLELYYKYVLYINKLINNKQ